MPRQESWWFEAQEKEMASMSDADSEEWRKHKPGPIGQLIDDFHAYTDELRNTHQTDEEANELVAKLKTEFPDISWEKSPGPVDEHMPEAEEDMQQYEESLMDKIHGRALHSAASLHLMRSRQSCLAPARRY